MKIVEKIKKGLIGLGAFLLTIPTKLFATDFNSVPSVYGPPPPDPEPESFILTIFKNILNIYKIVIIPVALIIGIVIYLKKSKSSKKRKIITVIISIAVVLALCLIISYIVDNVII